MLGAALAFFTGVYHPYSTGNNLPNLYFYNKKAESKGETTLKVCACRLAVHKSHS